MRKRPWTIKVIAMALAFVPCVTMCLLQVARSQGYGQNYDMGPMPEALIEFYVLIATSLITAYGVWMMRVWGFVMMLALGAIVISFDVYNMISNPKNLNLLDVADILLVTMALFFITQKKIRRFFFDPKLKWWNRPFRYPVNLVGRLEFNDDYIERPIFDLSDGGCLVGVQAFVDIPETFDLQIEYEGLLFRSQVKRVRMGAAPHGIGLAFVDLGSEQLSTLRQIVQAWQIRKSKASK